MAGVDLTADEAQRVHCLLARRREWLRMLLPLAVVDLASFELLPVLLLRLAAEAREGVHEDEDGRASLAAAETAR